MGPGWGVPGEYRGTFNSGDGTAGLLTRIRRRARGILVEVIGNADVPRPRQAHQVDHRAVVGPGPIGLLRGEAHQVFRERQRVPRRHDAQDDVVLAVEQSRRVVDLDRQGPHCACSGSLAVDVLRPSREIVFVVHDRLGFDQGRCRRLPVGNEFDAPAHGKVVGVQSPGILQREHQEALVDPGHGRFEVGSREEVTSMERRVHGIGSRQHQAPAPRRRRRRRGRRLGRDRQGPRQIGIDHEQVGPEVEVRILKRGHGGVLHSSEACVPEHHRLESRPRETRLCQVILIALIPDQVHDLLVPRQQADVIASVPIVIAAENRSGVDPEELQFGRRRGQIVDNDEFLGTPSSDRVPQPGHAVGLGHAVGRRLAHSRDPAVRTWVGEDLGPHAIRPDDEEPALVQDGHAGRLAGEVVERERLGGSDAQQDVRCLDERSMAVAEQPVQLRPVGTDGQQVEVAVLVQIPTVQGPRLLPMGKPEGRTHPGIGQIHAEVEQMHPRVVGVGQPVARSTGLLRVAGDRSGLDRELDGVVHVRVVHEQDQGPRRLLPQVGREIACEVADHTASQSLHGRALRPGAFPRGQVDGRPERQLGWRGRQMELRRVRQRQDGEPRQKEGDETSRSRDHRRVGGEGEAVGPGTIVPERRNSRGVPSVSRGVRGVSGFLEFGDGPASPPLAGGGGSPGPGHAHASLPG
jgi:hypothetical protein